MSLDDTPNEFGIGLMTLASEAGFEPTMTESKSVAFPLGYSETIGDPG